MPGDKELLHLWKELVHYLELWCVHQCCLDDDVSHVAAFLNLAEQAEAALDELVILGGIDLSSAVHPVQAGKDPRFRHGPVKKKVCSLYSLISTA